MRRQSTLRLALVTLCLSIGLGGLAAAQVGKGTIVDLNTAAEKDLLALPHMTPAVAKGLILLIPGAGTRMARESRSIGRGRPGGSSTRRSASTSGSRRPIVSSSTCSSRST